MSQLPPVSFPDWKGVLARSNLSAGVQAAYAREIITFLHHCKVSHAAATVELAKQYLSVREKQSTVPARSSGSGQARSTLPSSAGNDPVICNALYYISP